MSCHEMISQQFETVKSQKERTQTKSLTMRRLSIYREGISWCMRLYPWRHMADDAVSKAAPLSCYAVVSLKLPSGRLLITRVSDTVTVWSNRSVLLNPQVQIHKTNRRMWCELKDYTPTQIHGCNTVITRTNNSNFTYVGQHTTAAVLVSSMSG